MARKDLVNSVRTLLDMEGQIYLLIKALNTVFENTTPLNDIERNEWLNEQISLRDSLNTLLSNYSIILFDTFLKSYENRFIAVGLELELKKRVEIVRRVNKPGIDRLKRWSGLSDFRNTLAAHDFQAKKSSVSIYSREYGIKEYNIPNTNSEKNLFYKIISLCCWNIRQALPEIVKEIPWHERPLDRFKIIGKNVNCDEELDKIQEEMYRVYQSYFTL